MGCGLGILSAIASLQHLRTLWKLVRPSSILFSRDGSGSISVITSIQERHVSLSVHQIKTLAGEWADSDNLPTRAGF